jgi:glycosyltransferase involved in cell wall biosynthesis
MRIGMVLESPFPPDIRVEKEARALQTGGHEVALLCGLKGTEPTEERYSGISVFRVPSEPRGNKIRRLLLLIRYWITAHKGAWETAILRFVEDNGIQALHIHDLPLVPTGLAVARRKRIPLIFDMHEVYPVMIRERFPGHLNFRIRINAGIHSLMFSSKWWERVERDSVEQADRVIVVVDESKQRLVKMQIDGEKIFVVLNAEDVDQFLSLPQQPIEMARRSDEFLVGYVGGVDNPNRGLDNLIRAWPLLLKRLPKARLIIVGDGGLRPTIESLVKTLNLQDHVMLAGWVPFKEVPSYIRRMDLAVIPHVINEHTNNTIPHKLFQYIALGKLIVASDILPIRRVLQDTNAGLIVNDWSPEGFADTIAQAHDLLVSGKHDPAAQVIALRAKYGFEAISKPILKLYQGLNSLPLDKDEKEPTI